MRDCAGMMPRNRRQIAILIVVATAIFGALGVCVQSIWPDGYDTSASEVMGVSIGSDLALEVWFVSCGPGAIDVVEIERLGRDRRLGEPEQLIGSMRLKPNRAEGTPIQLSIAEFRTPDGGSVDLRSSGDDPHLVIVAKQGSTLVNFIKFQMSDLRHAEVLTSVRGQSPPRKIVRNDWPNPFRLTC